MKTKITKPIEKKVKKQKKMSDPGFTRMTEYSIEMTIPTGQFANIRPRITVVSQNPELAHAYCAPHMNKMWKEYFMVNERRNEVAPGLQQAPARMTPPSTVPVVPTASSSPFKPLNSDTVTPAPTASPTPTEPPPFSSVSFIKAKQAIESCASLEALDLIKNQVELSVKLEKDEKPALRTKIVERFNELNADAFIKKNT